MVNARRLDVKTAQLLVVDVQEKLLPYISGHEVVVTECVRMLDAARALGLRVTVTEQYPAGLGRTAAAVRSVVAGATRLEKMTFSAWRDAATREHLVSLARPQVLLVGIEAHVCVQQSALDLLDAGLAPFLLVDAVGSRRPRDRDTALERMRAAGVVVTTVESAIFEMLGRAGTELFRGILPIVR
jgi:nicotinamidase-related amidase